MIFQGQKIPSQIPAILKRRKPAPARHKMPREGNCETQSPFFFFLGATLLERVWTTQPSPLHAGQEEKAFLNAVERAGLAEGSERTPPPQEGRAGQGTESASGTRKLRAAATRGRAEERREAAPEAPNRKNVKKKEGQPLLSTATSMWQLCLPAVASCRPRVRRALRPGQKLLPSASLCPERTRPDGSRASQAPSPPSAPPRQPPFHLRVRWGKGDPAPLSCYINPAWGNIFVSFFVS
ncbi:uncharacterized protein LOC117802449 [Ailuropoda melanoleuca]|uniref:uncharacterized protein LOC117802449 n=1 Tax=Ailuropoda melanoleuca TaxID=9646 RepID=UPI001494529C|nr:uncharacterized protein LOC117802449 [Ailuropoda melanoleuca]